jgi:hypothetical protein
MKAGRHHTSAFFFSYRLTGYFLSCRKGTKILLQNKKVAEIKSSATFFKICFNPPDQYHP